MGLFLLPWLIFPAWIIFPPLLWRRILGESFEKIGWRPLVVGYLLFGLGWCLSCVTQFGWAELYLFYGTPVAMLLIGMVGVPVAAFLVRIGRASYWLAAVLLVLVLFGITTVHWMFPHNIWTETHRVEAFLSELGWLALLTLPGGAAFCFGLVNAVRRQQRGPLLPSPGSASANQTAGA